MDPFHRGANSDLVLDIALDASGNILATGLFTGPADFDPGPGTYYLAASAPDDTCDSFVCKLDPNGNLLWAKQFGKAVGFGPTSITIDKSGASYVAGLFQGVADFDPGANIHLLKAGGYQDGFILKLDADGNFGWVKQIEGNGLGHTLARCLELDTAGNLLIVGSFLGTADLDPGPPVLSVTSPKDGKNFLLKLDTAGNLSWVKHFGEQLHVFVLRIAKSGNMYLSGSFYSDTADVDPGTNVYHLPHKGLEDVFLMKLDKEGNFRWCNAIGGDSHDTSESIDFDSLENVYLSGRFREVVDFDPGPGTHILSTLTSADDSFLMQTDSSGKFIWASQIKGKMNYAYDIKVNRASEVFVVGKFQNPTDMDPGPDVLIFDTPSTSQWADSYLLKLVQDPSIGIEELLPKQISCFPNPFGNELTLNVEEMKNTRLHFFNVMGQELMLPTEKSGDKIRVNTTSLVPGIYLLQIYYAGGMARSKVVKH